MWKNDKLDKIQEGLIEQNIISIGGEIDDDATMYIREALLRLRAKGNPEITLQITSGGGSVDVGLDIYDFLRSYPGKKIGTVQGVARSMAAIILQACDKRIAMRHSSILIHHISKRDIGLDELRDKEKIAQILDTLEKSQARIYTILSEKTKHTIEEIKVECAKNEDMTAEDALSFGLVDEII